MIYIHHMICLFDEVKRIMNNNNNHIGDHLLKLTLFHTNDTFSQCIISMETPSLSC